MSAQEPSEKEQKKAERKALKKALKKQAKGQEIDEHEKPASLPGQTNGHVSEKKKDKKKRKAAAAGLDEEPSATVEAKDNVEKVQRADDKAARKALKKAKKDAKKEETHSKSPSELPEDPVAFASYLKANQITVEVDDGNDAPKSSVIEDFEQLRSRVDARVFRVIEEQNFSSPTPIQASCWPSLLSGRDVVGIAETGSGKTFGFGVPAVDFIVRSSSAGKQSHARALVVAPTRELAIQTQEQLEKLGKGCGLATFCVYGGVSKTDQVNGIKVTRPVIIVGTPGRLLDLARDGLLDLSHVDYVVLDEADRMLDKGFEPDIRAIMGMTKTQDRQTCMFSATWPPAVRSLAESFMRSPVRVTVGSDELSANRRITQTVHVLGGREKEWKLQEVLRNYYKTPGRTKKDRILVFALYKKEAQRVENNLRRGGHAVAGIHGDLSQQERISSLNSFKTATTPLLVATDVAARGLDIPNVELVINYTFPLTAEDYVHRIGRTGRGGKEGQSITFFTEEDKAHAGELIRILKDADQSVPEEMYQFPTTIKKKTHSSYGAHFKELVPGKAKKITFD